MTFRENLKVTSLRTKCARNTRKHEVVVEYVKSLSAVPELTGRLDNTLHSILALLQKHAEENTTTSKKVNLYSYGEDILEEYHKNSVCPMPTIFINYCVEKLVEWLEEESRDITVTRHIEKGVHYHILSWD